VYKHCDFFFSTKQTLDTPLFLLFSPWKDSEKSKKQGGCPAINTLGNFTDVKEPFVSYAMSVKD
jgi:hypothetical protein